MTRRLTLEEERAKHAPVDLTGTATPGKVKVKLDSGTRNPQVPGLSGETVNGEQHMAELCGEVLQRESSRYPQIRLVEVSPADLLGEAGGIAKHRLRFSDLRLHSSTCKTLSPTQFRSAIQAHLLERIASYAEVMPGAYRPVAVRVSKSSRQKWVKVPAEAKEHRWASNEGSEPRYHDSDQKTKRVLGEEPYLLFEFAYADISGRAPSDWMFEHQGKRTGGAFKFAESGGKMIFMPLALRTSRENAARVIRYFYDVSADEVFVEIDEATVLKAKAYIDLTLSIEEAATLLHVDAQLLKAELAKLPAKPEAKPETPAEESEDIP